MIPEQRLSTETIPGSYLYPDDQEITDVQDWEMGGIAIQDPSQGLQYQAWVSRYISSTGELSLIPVQEGSPTVILNKTGIIQHSFSFDQNMRWVLAYTLDSGTVELVWYDSTVEGYVTTPYTNGELYPRLALDDKRKYQVSASDVIFAYVKNGGLYFRAQRDRYLIEYPLIQSEFSDLELINMGMHDTLRLQFSLNHNLQPPPAPSPAPPPPPPPVPPATLIILNTTLPLGSVSSIYSVQLVARNGVSPYTWTIDYGILPPGLNLVGDTISGIPEIAGNYIFNIRVTDAGSATYVKSLAITVSAGVIPSEPIKLVGTIDPYAPASFLSTGPYEYAKNYYGVVKIENGAPPFRVSLNSGSLPPGYSLRSGQIDGVTSAYVYLSNATLVTVSNLYTQASSWSFSLKVIDANNSEATTSQSFQIPVGITSSAPLAKDAAVYLLTVDQGAPLDIIWTFSGGVGNFHSPVKNQIFIVNGLTLTLISPNQVRVTGIPTYGGYPTPWDTYWEWGFRVQDQRGGLGGNGMGEVKVRMTVNPP